MATETDGDYGAIDAVVNIWTPEALEHRPHWGDDFFVGKMGVDQKTSDGVPVADMLARMDRAGIEKGFLIATRAGPRHHPSCYRIPYELVAETCAQAPGRSPPAPALAQVPSPGVPSRWARPGQRTPAWPGLWRR